jgi:hypothetical protein
MVSCLVRKNDQVVINEPISSFRKNGGGILFHLRPAGFGEQRLSLGVTGSNSLTPIKITMSVHQLRQVTALFTSSFTERTRLTNEYSFRRGRRKELFSRRRGRQRIDGCPQTRHCAPTLREVKHNHGLAVITKDIPATTPVRGGEIWTNTYHSPAQQSS